MIKILTLNIVAFLLFSCSSDNLNTNEEKLIEGPNSSKINLAIGIKDDADLRLVFKTMNELKFDIRAMHGFSYLSNTPKSGIPDLIDLLNTKPYIKTGAWQATTSSVYYFEEDQKTRIVGSYFEMNKSNQEDWLELISSLKLTQKQSGNLSLSIPEGAQTYWKTELKKYSFVKWTETFDQVCISYEEAPVISIDTPEQGTLNQAIPIKIKFNVRNGCGSFSSLSETNSGNTKTITVKAKFEGCYCTQSIVTIETTYDFKATTRGAHILRFPQSNGDFLTHTINIQ